MNVLKSAQLNKYCDITALYFDIGDQPGFVVSLNDIQLHENLGWSFIQTTNNLIVFLMF